MRIWFNHWFSTAYRLMELLKQGDSNIEIIGTNKNDLAVYKVVCDEFFIEPFDLVEEDYNDWCLNFCKEHNIDVFFPRRERLVISRNIKKYDDINVKVLVDRNYKLVELLEDKIQTAEYFKKEGICKTPKMYVVNNYEGFMNAYHEIKDIFPEDRVCLKFNKDEGAQSFRVIDDSFETISALRTSLGHKLSLKTVVEMLENEDSFEDMIVMPYLKGPELSVDSLMTRKGFVGITRSKQGSRITEVSYNEELYNISKTFAEKSGLTMPYNLQVRFHNGELYLLEVNTRMAGGTHKSCLTGINIPYLAYCELIGKNFELPNVKHFSNLLVSEIETPLILN